MVYCQFDSHANVEHGSGLPNDIGRAGKCLDCGQSWEAIEWPTSDQMPHVVPPLDIDTLILNSIAESNTNMAISTNNASCSAGDLVPYENKALLLLISGVEKMLKT